VIDWLLPETSARLAAGPTVPVAAKVIGEPVSPASLAVTALGPATAPRVRTVEALPCASVATVAAESAPPPAVTVNCTVKPGTGLLPASRTMTTKGCSGAPALAVWLLPAPRAIWVAAPAPPVAVKV